MSNNKPVQQNGLELFNRYKSELKTRVFFRSANFNLLILIGGPGCPFVALPLSCFTPDVREAEKFRHKVLVSIKLHIVGANDSLSLLTARKYAVNPLKVVGGIDNLKRVF